MATPSTLATNASVQFLYLLGPSSFLAGLVYLFTLPEKTFFTVFLELAILIVQVRMMLCAAS